MEQKEKEIFIKYFKVDCRNEIFFGSLAFIGVLLVSLFLFWSKPYPVFFYFLSVMTLVYLKFLYDVHARFKKSVKDLDKYV